jgi:hypothetical protein
MEMIEKDHSLIVLNTVRLGVSLKIIFFRPMMVLLDLMVQICFLNDLGRTNSSMSNSSFLFLLFSFLGENLVTRCY